MFCGATIPSTAVPSLPGLEGEDRKGGGVIVEGGGVAVVGVAVAGVCGHVAGLWVVLGSDEDRDEPVEVVIAVLISEESIFSALPRAEEMS